MNRLNDPMKSTWTWYIARRVRPLVYYRSNEQELQRKPRNPDTWRCLAMKISYQKAVCLAHINAYFPYRFHTLPVLNPLVSITANNSKMVLNAITNEWDYRVSKSWNITFPLGNKNRYRLLSKYPLGQRNKRWIDGKPSFVYIPVTSRLS